MISAPELRKHVRIYPLILAAVLICGCNTVPVAEEVDQRQAVEITAWLNSHGIAATATKERKGYAVKVRRSAYSQAISLISQKRLPSELKMSFKQLVGEPGIIPSSREVEAMRLDHAMALELEEMLENHPAVSSAKVVVRINFRGQSPAPGVSVVIQQRPGAEVALEQIRKLVSAAAPGVSQENIQIAVAPVEKEGGVVAEVGKFHQDGKVLSVPLAPFLFWRVPEGSLTVMAITFVGISLLALLVGMLAGYALGTLRRIRSEGSGGAPETVPLLALKIDKGKKPASGRVLPVK